MGKFFTFAFFLFWISAQNLYAQNSQVQSSQVGPSFATNGGTAVNVMPWIGIINDPNFVETAIEIQVSESSTFNSLTYQLVSSTPTTQTTTFFRQVPSSNPLKFNTTYFLRVRTFVNTTPSPWSNVVTFSTKLPTIRVDQPSEGTTLSTANISFTATTEPGITHYTWELEETSPVARAVTSRTVTSQSTNFSGFLERGKRYRVRVRGEAQAYGIIGPFSPWRNFSMESNIFLPATYVVNIDGKSITSSTDIIYANNFRYNLRTVAVAGANRYNWQFDDTFDFSSLSLTVSTSNNTINLNTSQLESGKLYYVRVQAENTDTGETSNLATAQVRRYYNSLHPVSLSDVTELITAKGNLTLFAPVIANATDLIFQIDDDPNFGSPHVNPTWISTNSNSTYPGIIGNVFKANRYWNATNKFSAKESNATHRVFDRVFGYSSGTYYVRVRAVNPNQSGNWSTVVPVIANIPPLSVTFTITNGAEELPVTINTKITNDINYIETSVDVQISADDFQTTVYKLDNYRHGGTSQAPIPTITNLKFNTTYKARVRGYINFSYPDNPSEWTTITFSTQGAPIVSIYGVPASPWAGKGAHIYATQQAGIDQYEWQVEKTNTPVSEFTKTTTLFYTNFKGYLQNGGQYRVRVRGNATAQGINGVWTNWVTFSVSNTAARIAGVEENTVNQAAESFSQLASYPNPFSESTKIIIGNEYGKVKIRVSDSMGRFVQDVDANGGEVIELGIGWAKGLYIVTITDEQSLIKTIKIIKQ